MFIPVLVDIVLDKIIILTSLVSFTDKQDDEDIKETLNVHEEQRECLQKETFRQCNSCIKCAF